MNTRNIYLCHLNVHVLPRVIIIIRSQLVFLKILHGRLRLHSIILVFFHFQKSACFMLSLFGLVFTQKPGADFPFIFFHSEKQNKKFFLSIIYYIISFKLFLQFFIFFHCGFMEWLNIS